MARDPTLRLVRPGRDAAPKTFGKAGAALWRAILAEYDIRDSGGRAMLAQAAEAADRVAEFSAQIARDGTMLMTRHGPKEHPLLKHELANRAFVTRTLVRLGVAVEATKAVGRPPAGGVGISWRDLEREDADEPDPA